MYQYLYNIYIYIYVCVCVSISIFIYIVYIVYIKCIYIYPYCLYIYLFIYLGKYFTRFAMKNGWINGQVLSFAVPVKVNAAIFRLLRIGKLARAIRSLTAGRCWEDGGWSPEIMAGEWWMYIKWWIFAGKMVI